MMSTADKVPEGAFNMHSHALKERTYGEKEQAPIAK